MTVKSFALAALLSTVAAASFAHDPSNNTASPTSNASPVGMAASSSTAAQAKHSDKDMHKAAGKQHDMKKSNNTAAPASAATK